MLGKIIIYLLLILTQIKSTLTISCKDESGSDIPTWTIMKMPNSTTYYYYDTNTELYRSPHSLNDTTVGSFANTFKQLWDSNTQYILYNDEPPNDPTYNFSVAHSKAVWMWDSTSAILITHSIPKFPQGPQEQTKYVGMMSNAWVYGQAATCLPISLNALPLVISEVKKTVPLVYEISCDNCFFEVIDKNGADMTTDPCSVTEIDGGNYTLFTKLAATSVDIWASCIAPYFSSQIAVESWIHGTMDGSYCPPTYPFDTVDIQELAFPGGPSFKEYYDHSKWGILESPRVCFGDLNRVTSQKSRAGTVFCWADKSLWTSLNSLIVSTGTC